jgi:hypothetical protein
MSEILSSFGVTNGADARFSRGISRIFRQRRRRSTGRGISIYVTSFTEWRERFQARK